LLGQVADCGRDLGLTVQWQSSGGVCDGNRLAAAGLTTVDTLGPRGGLIHSDQEFLTLDSLAERAKLSALLLMGYASGRFTDPMSSVEPVS
jgi:glutamate carboxypeptidase